MTIPKNKPRETPVERFWRAFVKFLICLMVVGVLALTTLLGQALGWLPPGPWQAEEEETSYIPKTQQELYERCLTVCEKKSSSGCGNNKAKKYSECVKGCYNITQVNKRFFEGALEVPEPEATP
jgi:hypothetical protein